MTLDERGKITLSCSLAVFLALTVSLAIPMTQMAPTVEEGLLPATTAVPAPPRALTEGGVPSDAADAKEGIVSPMTTIEAFLPLGIAFLAATLAFVSVRLRMK